MYVHLVQSVNWILPCPHTHKSDCLATVASRKSDVSVCFPPQSEESFLQMRRACSRSHHTSIEQREHSRRLVPLLPCISAKSFSANCEWVRPEDTKTLSPSCRLSLKKQKYTKEFEAESAMRSALNPRQHFSACAGWSVVSVFWCDDYSLLQVEKRRCTRRARTRE